LHLLQWPDHIKNSVLVLFGMDIFSTTQRIAGVIFVPTKNKILSMMGISWFFVHSFIMRLLSGFYLLISGFSDLSSDLVENSAFCNPAL